MTSYFSAPELCDGIVNTCGGSLPLDEQDDDGDGYVECDQTLWFGKAVPMWLEDWTVLIPISTVILIAYNEVDTELCMTDSDGDGFGDMAAQISVQHGL